MGKIETILQHDEKVIKKQSKIQYTSKVGMPVGDLYLTNKRLLFLVSRGWSLLSITPSGSLTGKNLAIPLDEINMVTKGTLGSLKVEADKVHVFSVSVFKASGWVDSILQATSLKPPSFEQTPNPQPTTSVSKPVGKNNFCSNCGLSLKPGAKFCSNCGAKV
jgi:hypothetical protein